MALRILAVLAVLTLVLTSWVGTAEAQRKPPKTMSQKIAEKAKEYADAGRTDWTYAAYNWYTGSDAYKCNIFVADVVKAVGGTVPHRWWGMSGPIGAGEWGNPNSTLLTEAPCWSYRSSPSEGYVIGDGRHVGIVTGSRETTSAMKTELVSNDWGFRSFGSGSRSSMKAYWKYIC